MSILTALETSGKSLQKLWEAEDSLTKEERTWLHNAFMGSLSSLIPEDIWEKALRNARESVEVYREQRKKQAA